MADSSPGDRVWGEVITGKGFEAYADIKSDVRNTILDELTQEEQRVVAEGAKEEDDTDYQEYAFALDQWVDVEARLQICRSLITSLQEIADWDENHSPNKPEDPRG